MGRTGVHNYGGQGSESAVETRSNQVPSPVRVVVKIGLSPISIRTPPEEH